MSRVLTMLTAAFILMIALPTVVHARAAVTEFAVDRTTVTTNQEVNFDIETNAATNFVFAMVDGTRTQAERLSDESGVRTWRITLTFERSATVNVFANTANNENRAVRLRVPINVTDITGAPDQAAPPTGNIPPLGIHSIIETPARNANEVQLTVITGTAVNEVWTRVTEGRYVMGERLSRDNHSQTWVINYVPPTRVFHTMQVWANRTYTWPGATTMSVDVHILAPQAPANNPLINTVNISPNNPGPGATSTIRIRTNQHVQHVWVRDTTGVERVARRITPTTPVQRNWEVTVNPYETGEVTIFANVTRTAEGAAQQTETITVGVGTPEIISATATQPARNAANVFETLVQVTTNMHARSAFAVMTGSTQAHPMTRVSGTNTSNQVWEIRLPTQARPITVRVSGTATSTANDLVRTINDWTGVGGARITNVSTHTAAGTVISANQLPRGEQITLRITTTDNVDNLTVIDNTPGAAPHTAQRVTSRDTAGYRAWEVTYTVPNVSFQGITMTINARIPNVQAIAYTTTRNFTTTP